MRRLPPPSRSWHRPANGHEPPPRRRRGCRRERGPSRRPAPARRAPTPTAGRRAGAGGELHRARGSDLRSLVAAAGGRSLRGGAGRLGASRCACPLDRAAPGRRPTPPLRGRRAALPVAAGLGHRGRASASPDTPSCADGSARTGRLGQRGRCRQPVEPRRGASGGCRRHGRHSRTPPRQNPRRHGIVRRDGSRATRIEIGGELAIVRAVEPLLGERELRLVVQLRRDGVAS